MKESIILQHLEEIVERLNVKIWYVNLKKESFNLKGGLCKLKGKFLLIINNKLHLSEKIDLIIDALQEFDIDSIYIHPYVRKLIERKSSSTTPPYSSSQSAFNTTNVESSEIIKGGG